MCSQVPPPDVVALLVCDQIITDRLTGKLSLIGLFSKVNVTKFPAVHPQLSVFVALTEGRGETDLKIRIVDGNDSRPPLVEGKGRVQFRNPRDITHVALQFHGLKFPQPGEYRVQLWSGNSLLREARLELLQAQPRSRPQGQEGGPPTDFAGPGAGDPPPGGPQWPDTPPDHGFPEDPDKPEG